MKKFPPERIVCLTEETVETIYLLGEEKRIVGVTGYATRPKRVRNEKPRISSFISANINKIINLEPDLVLAFSDIQAEIVSELIKKNFTVLCFNQRDINGIFNMIDMIGSILNVKLKSDKLIKDLKVNLESVNQIYNNNNKLKVYFEEWNDPYITAIKWVSELIEIVGGKDIFKNISSNEAAKNRIISDKQIIKANPDLIIGSWCGKKVNFKEIISRPNWSNINAVKNNNIFEIKSSKILQPGPAALTDGLEEMIKIFKKVKV